jgi:prepilin-type N-terminal cleavage/methylation domain-containing protein
MWTEAGADSTGAWVGLKGTRARGVGPARAFRGWAAFTLLEILLAVALLGILSAALVSIAPRLVNERPQTPTEIFWEAVRTARRSALTSEREVRLSFDSKEKEFVLRGGEDEKKFPVPETRDLTIDFLPPQSSGSLLVGGQLVDMQSIPSVSFYPDGTCSPFRIQFRTTGPARVEAIDPWTCAPVLTEPKKT